MRAYRTSSGGILEKLSIDRCTWEVDVSYDTSSDEDVLNTRLPHVSISFWLHVLISGSRLL